MSLCGAAYLGFALIDIVHDKLLHFVTFCILTVEFYFIFDTQFKSLKVIRYLTFAICTISGSIFLEVLQHLVNENRTFDVYDILSNILGSTLGLVLCVCYLNYKKGIAKRERLKYHRVANINAVEENAVLTGEQGEQEEHTSHKVGTSTPIPLQSIV